MLLAVRLFPISSISSQFYSNIQSVPRSKHCVSVTKNSHLMLYREIMAVCSEIHTKHINTVCGQNAEMLNVKLAVYIVTTGGTYTYHYALKGSRAVTRLLAVKLYKGS